MNDLLDARMVQYLAITSASSTIQTQVFVHLHHHQSFVVLFGFLLHSIGFHFKTAKYTVNYIQIQ